MLYKLASLVLLSSSVFGLPIRREVPQEHSHERFLTSVRASLNLNNPDGIVDPVFALLGNAVASQGLGRLTDPDCLQQATADQAFTNAKAAGDVQGQVDALIFRALERNSGRVGQASAACTSLQAVNPEIAAIQQHQDPASPNAAAINKAIVLELAKQIAAVGGDPLEALNSGTFAPGDVNDPTGRGNSCDVQDDPVGCIFTQNLLVPDATEAEIQAAVAGVAAGGAATNTAGNGGNANTNNNNNNTGNSSSSSNSSGSNSNNNTNNQTGGRNLQTFTGTLGGSAAPAVVAGGRGFLVSGSDSFLNVNAALGRSCDIQHNACANAANSGKVAGLSVGQCDQQNNACKGAIGA